MSKEYLNQVVQILKSKKGAIYIKVTEDGEAFKKFVSNLKPGDAIFCESQEDTLNGMCERGVIDSDRRDELIGKTDFIKFNGTFSYDKN